ncbi:hypothetical protein PIB30_045679 [Stylosanthes scabra]|uniref:TF-B3 domain-containing protein n=1 Tax=Stylosanthes scabra TaxID=79078 RepID=A0ABU6RGE7_9FABA|nr:hypothetical protein [Stylosanthes scabra]
MARVATPEPPVKLLLSQSPISDVLSSRKPSSHSNQALHENDNGLIEMNGIHVPAVTVRSQPAKECHPPVTQVAPDAGVVANHAVYMTLAATATKNDSFDGIGFNGSRGMPSGSKACIFCPGAPQCKLAAPHKPPTKQSQKQHGNSIKGAPLPPWDLKADLSLFVTCEKEIVGSQNDNSAMVLPSFFYKKAFPTMPKSVLAISELTLPARLGLRWNKHRNYQMFVTKGWKDFAAANGFTDGKLVRFSVPVGDENIMFVYLAKA